MKDMLVDFGQAWQRSQTDGPAKRTGDPRVNVKTMTRTRPLTLENAPRAAGSWAGLAPVHAPDGEMALSDL